MDTTTPGAHGAAAPSRPACAGRWVLVPLALGLAVGMVLALLRPPVDLGRLRGERGDARLTAAARAVLGERGRDSVEVAEVRDGRITTATVGPQRGRFELGSITKTFNGHLLADAVSRGEVRLDDRLDRHLPRLTGTPAGSITLEELATHTSGLPRLPRSMLPAALVQAVRQDDPYAGRTVDDLLQDAATADLEGRGYFAYSNFGAALLGHALVAASHQPDWPTLVRTRLLDPLGMTSTTFAVDLEHLPADRVRGHTENGLQARPWVSAADAPAGTSTWTTAEDLAKYARAVMDGAVPGADAVTMREDIGPGKQVGLHWLQSESDGHTILWHNGGTGGAATYLGIDRKHQSAVVLLGSSAADVDSAGRALLQDRPIASTSPTSWTGVVVLILALGQAILLGARLLQPTTRTRWLGPVLDACTVCLLAWRLGPWQLVPVVILGALAGVVAAGLVVGAWQARTLPWAGPHPGRSWIAVGVSSVILAVVLGLVMT